MFKTLISTCARPKRVGERKESGRDTSGKVLYPSPNVASRYTAVLTDGKWWWMQRQVWLQRVAHSLTHGGTLSSSLSLK